MGVISGIGNCQYWCLDAIDKFKDRLAGVPLHELIIELLPELITLAGVIVRLHGNTRQREHWQLVDKQGLSQELPLLVEHANRISRSEGEREGLRLARFENLPRVVAEEALLEVTLFRGDVIASLDFFPLICHSG